MTSNHTLTRIYLNPARRGGRKLILNPQAMHAAVRAAFPPDTDESRGRILWRLDHHEHAHTLYIVGPERPDVANIVEQAGWHTTRALCRLWKIFGQATAWPKVAL